MSTKSNKQKCMNRIKADNIYLEGKSGFENRGYTKRAICPYKKRGSLAFKIWWKGYLDARDAYMGRSQWTKCGKQDFISPLK